LINHLIYATHKHITDVQYDIKLLCCRYSPFIISQLHMVVLCCYFPKCERGCWTPKSSSYDFCIIFYSIQ